MLKIRAQSRPESSSGNNFTVRTSGIVVTSDCSTCGNIGLSLNSCSYKERRIVMLLMERENQIVQKLAAGNRRIVSQNRINEARSVFQLTVSSKNKTYAHCLIEHMGTVAYNSVHKLNPFAYLA